MWDGYVRVQWGHSHTCLWCKLYMTERAPIWLFSQILHARRGEERSEQNKWFSIEIVCSSKKMQEMWSKVLLSQGIPLVTILQPCPSTSCLDPHQTGEDDHFCRRQNKDTELSMFLVSHIYRPSFVSLRKPCGGGGMNGRSLQVGICMFGMCWASVWPLYNNVGPVSCWHTKDLLTEIPIRS